MSNLKKIRFKNKKIQKFYLIVFKFPQNKKIENFQNQLLNLSILNNQKIFFNIFFFKQKFLKM